MDLNQVFESFPIILAEGSIYERVRRTSEALFDPFIAHAGLIYHERGRNYLEQIHREYLQIGLDYRLPMVVLSDTWRASTTRINQSKYRGLPVNIDHATFLRSLCDEYKAAGSICLLAGLIGPAGDAYRPEESLSAENARRYHSAQVEVLVSGRIDLLVASTLPALSEALGMAHVMSDTSLPYVLSFVVRPDGRALDGLPLEQIIRTIDDTVNRPPFGYMVNCVHPTVCRAALRQSFRDDQSSLDRFIGLQANTSRRSPDDLDGLVNLESEDSDVFAAGFFELIRSFPVRIAGGCCGTDGRHIDALARVLSRLTSDNKGGDKNLRT